MTKVLVIGDYGQTRFVTAHTLKYLGCKVIEFPDAMMALKVLRIGNPFDIIFTDLRIPGMDGLELLQEIKRMYPNAHVVLTSPDLDPDTQCQAEQNGAAACLFGQPGYDAYKAVIQRYT
jgi:CheY-like chemotaxis protein